MLARGPTRKATDAAQEPLDSTRRILVAKGADHIWHVDLTTIPTSLGFWVPWPPFSRPQRWPFCCWAAIAVDHASRLVIGFALFKRRPTAAQVTAFLSITMRRSDSRPRHIIAEKGKEFFCRPFKDWCRQHGIRPRFGAIGQHGSIAVVERFIRSMKSECTSTSSPATPPGTTSIDRTPRSVAGRRWMPTAATRRRARSRDSSPGSAGHIKGRSPGELVRESDWSSVASRVDLICRSLSCSKRPDWRFLRSSVSEDQARGLSPGFVGGSMWCDLKAMAAYESRWTGTAGPSPIREVKGRGGVGDGVARWASMHQRRPGLHDWLGLTSPA
jgi:transposase InsO family protein